jgi:hypothetical protein
MLYSLPGQAFSANAIEVYQLSKGWLAGIAFGISELAAYVSTFVSEGNVWKFVIAALNGFVIFSAAMGQNQAGAAVGRARTPTAEAKGAEELQASGRWGVFRSWL